jgi:hypothetical protein
LSGVVVVVGGGVLWERNLTMNRRMYRNLNCQALPINQLNKQPLNQFNSTTNQFNSTTNKLNNQQTKQPTN